MTDGWPLGPHSTLRERTATAVADPVLRSRLHAAVDRFGSHRTAGLAELHDPDALRRAARAVKAALIADLPATLERLADNALASGTRVHWAPDAADANRYIVDVARRAAAARPAAAPDRPAW